MNDILKYLFSPAPGVKFSFYTIFLVLFLILLTGALISRFLIKKHKNPAFKKNFGTVPLNLLYFAAIIGFLVFSRYENIAFFSMRFMLYFTLLIFVYWTGKQVYTFFKKYKKESKEIAAKMNIPKYTTKKHR
ncbi:MAG: hypothetical protein US89_C0002G0094 [Candidatus Peregrinibacteria bacterium GW2011_GWF2_38_29]|nr:MAG: hypothetical protein US89_C0002G0094 [Candidatus Peregrinibacteria bacterium GW2011_GWF2_38_29]HBB02252.1 hypothetical protein [Candidatus Peregrinibacteria bacterium]